MTQGGTRRERVGAGLRELHLVEGAALVEVRVLEGDFHVRQHLPAHRGHGRTTLEFGERGGRAAKLESAARGRLPMAISCGLLRLALARAHR